jgi:hypothetical protein
VVRVIVPVVPARFVDVGPLTAMGTFVKVTVSRAKLPDVFGRELAFLEVEIPTGVLVKELSMTTTEPTSCAEDPPLDISIPIWQLLIERPV